MDMSSVLAYKSLFLANRAKGTISQANEGKKCTAVANGARVAVTTAQTAVPLFAVADCLTRTARNKTLQTTANSIKNSGLKNIVVALNSNKTAKALDGVTSTVKILSKLGVAANITYAAAKCIDAKAEDKNEVLLQASGNCAGMYLFEKLYSSAVKTVSPDEITNGAKKLSKSFNKKLPFLKSIKGSSILIGLGFVIASFLGCYVGEKIGKAVYDSTDEGKIKKLRVAEVPVTNINKNA